MLIYKNRPKHNWLSPYTIIEKVVFWREIDYDEPMVKFWHNVLLPFCLLLQSIGEFFNRDIHYVRIDPWDTWNMDSVLTPIILPMLKQLKKDKQGAPYVDNEDVPAHLRDKRRNKNKGDTDKNWFKRYDYVMDEMIWAFTELNKEDWSDPFYTGEIDHVWVGDKLKKGPKHTLKFDKKAHDKHWARIQNGLRLFCKYYTSLWD